MNVRTKISGVHFLGFLKVEENFNLNLIRRFWNFTKGFRTDETSREVMKSHGDLYHLVSRITL